VGKISFHSALTVAETKSSIVTYRYASQDRCEAKNSQACNVSLHSKLSAEPTALKLYAK
jgi:hypothetical protein